MQASPSHKSSPRKGLGGGGRRTPMSPDSTSTSEDFDEGEFACVDALDGNELSDLDDLSGGNSGAEAARKPHFLDYDYMEARSGGENPGESLKIDKSLERDGEVSDHVLTAAYCNEKKYKNKEKKKHFLDENPIPPPEYVPPMREHRSLDRLDGERKTKQKDNYTLNRFIEREVPNSEAYRGTWPSVSEPGFRAAPTALDLGPKMECVYSLLSMLGSTNSEEMSKKFLEMSRNREACASLRRSGCISILVQLQHNDPSETVRKNAGAALHNVVHCTVDDKFARREMRVLKQIEQLIEYCDVLRAIMNTDGETVADDSERHPVLAIGTLMKTSFDEDHRHAMCQLGALQTISTLIQLDHRVHSANSEDPNCVTLRRYAGMTLTNLTFGDGNNKALLCSNRGFMRALVSQIDSTSDELVQVTASVLRNLSWRADPSMKVVLSEIGAVTILTKAAMGCNQENTLKAILSALWNLSNSPQNKAEFCECSGAIDFLIDMLNFEAPSKTMHVIENAGGILRNVSSYIATKEEYRAVLRRRNCLSILLQQLKSSSLTVVSNASGTLGNLSANCPEDQKFLRDNGAIPMLRSLICSKHKMISTGCTLALRNLLNYQKSGLGTQPMDAVSRALDLKELPTLSARKQKALEQELDQNLANSCSSDEVTTPPKDLSRNLMTRCFKQSPPLPRSSKEKPRKNAFDTESEVADELPIDYSKKYGDLPAQALPGPSKGSFQEQESDQPTDYSKRYAENNTYESEDEEDKSSPFDARQVLVEDDDPPPATTDCVTQFYTEGTPQVISNAPSVTDLSQLPKGVATANLAKMAPPLPKPEIKRSKGVSNSSGIHSPERPVNYCVEGTPGGLSRCDSLSDLEPEGGKTTTSKIKSPPRKKEPEAAKTPAQGNFIDDTPLMFSRTSSLGSLESQEEVAVNADDGSVVSEFSRLASGIISPSEIPESPLQSMPQSPRKRSLTAAPIASSHANPECRDEVTPFAVENTPAHFSCATSLSNLSLDDEPKITKDCLAKEMLLMNHPSEDQEDEYVLHYAEDGPPPKDESGNNLHESGSSDEEGEGDNGDDLLQSAINMGMNSHIAPPPVAPEEEVKQYCTENTPAVLSKAGSNSNLSVLSLETRPISEDGSADEALLEAAIQNGIKGVAARVENPIEKMRKGALPPYLPVGDEMSRFYVEDSPRAFSTVSGLSSLTVGSGIAGPAQLKSSPAKHAEQTRHHRPSDDRSLSSLSVEENENDMELLNQAIAVGVAFPSRQVPPNDSFSSIESCDSIDNQSQQLLEQVVQSGIAKVTKGAKMSSKSRRKMTDQELLQETIQQGMRTATGSKNGQAPPEVGTSASRTTSGGRAVRATTKKKEGQHDRESIRRAADGPAINKSTQSLDWSTHLDLLSRSNEYPAQRLRISGCDFSADTFSEMEVSNEFLVEKWQDEKVETETVKEGRATMEEKRKNPDLMLRSVDRLTQELVATAEYLRAQTIAQKSQGAANLDDGSNPNTWNDSNDISFPSLSGLGPLNGSTNDDENTFNDLKSSFSNRLPAVAQGDEATPVNEVREFSPAPQIVEQVLRDASLDATLRFDTTNEGPGSLDSIDGVRQDSSEIKFRVGGEVHLQPASIQAPAGPMSIDSCSTTMTNSTIIFMEANKLATELQNLSPTDSLASLDLDNIRPPSVMDCVSLSTFTYDMYPSSPQLPRSRKTSIPTGIMARRALGQHLGSTQRLGSAESLTSLAVDNIKPPSIMDELLDSMISVASITSEIAPEGASPTHYETALSEMDDTTLQSCYPDLPNDATPIQSDFSSNESTPKKGGGGIRRALTPKQKRQMAKDRFRTYTIAADMVLKERADELIRSQEAEDEILQVEVLQERQKLTPRQKRREDRARFETQVLDTSQLNLSSASEGSESPLRRLSCNSSTNLGHLSLPSNDDTDEDLSIKAVTANLKFLRALPDPRTSNLSRTSTNIIQIRGAADDKFSSSDVTSLEYEQSSETESCDQNRFSDSNDEGSRRPRILKPVEVHLDSAGDEGGCSSPEPRGVRGRKKPAYVSPYKMSGPSGNSSRTTSPKSSISPIPRQTGGASKLIPKNQTIIAKTHVIINKANLTNKINTIKTGLAKPGFLKTQKPPPKSGMSKSKTYTEISSHCEPLGGGLERQGTFVKEEGTDLDVPVVTSAPPTPAKSSKLPTPKPPKSAPLRGSRTSLVSKLRIPLQKSATQAIPRPTSTAAPPKSRLGGVYKSPSVPVVAPQRSNSNASLKSTGNTAPVVKKDITSRIAGLWKKVDESKKQQGTKKDTRVWIGGGKKEQEPLERPLLIRSSTFDASSPDEHGAKKSVSNLPIITKARTLKSPSSGNLKADGRFFIAKASRK